MSKCSEFGRSVSKKRGEKEHVWGIQRREEGVQSKKQSLRGCGVSIQRSLHAYFRGSRNRPHKNVQDIQVNR